MANVCTICRHNCASEINGALIESVPLRTVADRWSVSKTALIRHKKEHLPTALVKAKDAADILVADSLVAKITKLELEAARLGKKAENCGDLRGAMVAVRELIRIVELLAKLQGDIKEPLGSTIQVVYVNAQGVDKANQVSRGATDSRDSDRPANASVVDITPKR